MRDKRAIIMLTLVFSAGVTPIAIRIAHGEGIPSLVIVLLRATALAILLQVGVVVSAVIALLVFGEVPSVAQVAGSALVIYGVVVATYEQTRARWRHGSV